ncbi:helix-turn-helix domain-containing protein [Nocardiopsis gilva]|uniref:helix-turn-helix domain-containing protein n=1 Tax=Nocardiopsis gilva TaxID=280236 RepID=UPI001376E584|nr:helix-turn-helix domain-containing protein [Nocardiopsis gilva]
MCTDDVAPGERIDYWQHMVSENFVRCTTRIDQKDDSFWGRVVSTNLGAVHYSLVEYSASGSYEIFRSARQIRQDETDEYLLELQMGGSAVVLNQDGRQADFDNGDFGLLDVTRPSHLVCAPQSSVRAVTVTFPRHLLPIRVDNVRPLTAVRIPGKHGMGQLVSNFLVGLSDSLESDPVEGSDGVRLSTALLDLLAVAFARQLERESDVPPESHRGALLTRIYAFIDEQLDDPDLSPQQIASAHHISTRYLHKLFEPEETTVVEWIRTRRLEQCRRHLVDPGQRSQPVSVIAARWGFRDPSYFSRLFRATYGIPPREYRILHFGPEAFRPVTSMP